jgi:Domain of unknown function (DUF4260)
MTAAGRALRSDQAIPSTAVDVPVAVSTGRRLRARHLWLIPGLAIAVIANVQAGDHGLGIGPLLLFGIVPHLPVLLGIGQPHARGQMARRAVPLFNLMHHPVVPITVLALAAVGVLSPLWLVGGMAWFSHIVVDLALGDGLRTRDGWRRGWWAR